MANGRRLKPTGTAEILHTVVIRPQHEIDAPSDVQGQSRQKWVELRAHVALEVAMRGRNIEIVALDGSLFGDWPSTRPGPSAPGST